MPGAAFVMTSMRVPPSRGPLLAGPTPVRDADRAGFEKGGLTRLQAAPDCRVKPGNDEFAWESTL